MKEESAEPSGVKPTERRPNPGKRLLIPPTRTANSNSNWGCPHRRADIVNKKSKIQKPEQGVFQEESCLVHTREDGRRLQSKPRVFSGPDHTAGPLRQNGSPGSAVCAADSGEAAAEQPGRHPGPCRHGSLAAPARDGKPLTCLVITEAAVVTRSRATEAPWVSTARPSRHPRRTLTFHRETYNPGPRKRPSHCLSQQTAVFDGPPAAISTDQRRTHTAVPFSVTQKREHGEDPAVPTHL